MNSQTIDPDKAMENDEANAEVQDIKVRSVLSLFLRSSSLFPGSFHRFFAHKLSQIG
jgi:hypothetical protein